MLVSAKHQHDFSTKHQHGGMWELFALDSFSPCCGSHFLGGVHNLVISLVGTTFWFKITECLNIILPLKNVLADIRVTCDWISFFGGLYSTLLGLVFSSLYSWANLALLLRQNSSGIFPKYSIYSLRSFYSVCLELEHLPIFAVSPVWIVVLTAHWKMSFPE